MKIVLECWQKDFSLLTTKWQNINNLHCYKQLDVLQYCNFRHSGWDSCIPQWSNWVTSDHNSHYCRSWEAAAMTQVIGSLTPMPQSCIEFLVPLLLPSLVQIISNTRSESIWEHILSHPSLHPYLCQIKKKLKMANWKAMTIHSCEIQKLWKQWVVNRFHTIPSFLLKSGQNKF